MIKKDHSIAYRPDRKTEATDYSCVQVRDSHDSVAPIYEDKDGNEEGELVRQVYPLEASIAFAGVCGLFARDGFDREQLCY
jgi:hypothetical protein